MSLVQAMNETVNSGSLIGRADLSDDQMAEAIRARLRATGRGADTPEAIIEAAQRGDVNATSLVRTIAVPAPVARLSMPTQRLTRDGRNRFGLAYARLSSLVRG